MSDRTEIELADDSPTLLPVPQAMPVLTAILGRSDRPEPENLRDAPEFKLSMTTAENYRNQCDFDGVGFTRFLESRGIDYDWETPVEQDPQRRELLKEFLAQEKAEEEEHRLHEEKKARDLIADGFVTVRDAARYLNVSKRFVEELMENGELANTVIGENTIRIPRRALQEMVLENMSF